MSAPASWASPIRATSAGERNGPPEDCGGIPGFYELLEAITDPTHPSHAHLNEWAGDYDPTHSMHFRSNMPSRASQTVATPPRRASPRKTNSARLPDRPRTNSPRPSPVFTRWLPLNRELWCSSLAARNATFLLALILIASPVAGLRPIRAARFLTCKIPRPAIPTRSPFLRCLVIRPTRSPRRASPARFVS